MITLLTRSVIKPSHTVEDNRMYQSGINKNTLPSYDPDFINDATRHAWYSITQAAPAHADLPEDSNAFAATSATNFINRHTTLRGMLDSGCYPHMRRNSNGLSNKTNVNIGVSVAKEGVGSIATISGRIERVPTSRHTTQTGRCAP